MSKMLGAPAGGTTRGGHQGFESLALSLMTPPNAGGAGGRTRPLMEMVELGLPGVPLSTPSEAAVGAEPPGCALALPDRNGPPNAAASAAFAVDRNRCRRFILMCSVRPG